MSDRSRSHRNRALGVTAAAFALLLDQGTKWGMTHVLRLQARPEMDVVPIFKLIWTENRGVSMHLLGAGSGAERWPLVALTGAIAVFVLAWLWRVRRGDEALALGLILGGALGNILDRIRLGYVIDFANLHFGDVSPFLVFNVGDAAISSGVLMLAARALLARERTAPPVKA